jgi:dipeptidyl-peptidase-4
MTDFLKEEGMYRASRCLVRCALSIAIIISLGWAFSATPSFAQATAPTQRGKQLTLERLFGPPYLGGNSTEGIEWSPDGKRLSYLERKGYAPEGATELWTMDAATGERKVLVSADTMKAVMQPEKASAIQSTGLGRVQAESYKWSPNGDALLFAGSGNLVLLDLKTMTSKPLVAGEEDVEDPKFSPDGKWVGFVRGNNIWVVGVTSGESKALTSGGSEEILKGKLDWVYPEELDASTAYWWSPDSSKIAYYEMDERPVTRYPIMDMSSPLGGTTYTRYPQAGEANPIVRVGIVVVSGGETKWMDTGAATDIYLPRVNWLQDSRSVAIQRLNRAQNQLDLLFCDASTGASATIVTETDKYWINISDDLYFFSDNKRFLWSSERSGFRHYYLYDLSGKLLEQLTSGDWEITGSSGFGSGSNSHSAVDEKHGFIYFISDKENPIETQLYRVSLRDKSITAITHERGTHNVTISPDNTAFVDDYSNAMTPSRQDLFRMDGTRVAIINDGKVPELADYDLATLEFVNVLADDGTKLCASILKPPHLDPSKKYPVLINVYGGPSVQTVRNEWEGLGLLWEEMMAQKGYIIFALDNRGSMGRGHAFETPIYHQLGKIELEDQLAGVKYLKSLGYVDSSRIGIMGGSYGGYMTLDALFNAADTFRVGVSLYPVSDWRLYDTIYTERYMGRPQDNAESYTNSSPVNQAAKMKGKLMLAHGTGDDNVHFANTIELLNAFLDSSHYPDQLMIFPGRGHGIGDPAAAIQLYKRVTEFLLNNL